MAFTLGLAQCTHPADGDVLSMAERWMKQARTEGADLLVFPESLMTPYERSPESFAAAAEPIDGPFCTAMNDLARANCMWIVYTANEAGKSGKPYNTAVLTGDDGAIRATYRKVHLFDTNFTRESDKVAPGTELPAVAETPFGRIGLAICYDLRFPELARAAALAGCDVLVYPAAWVDGPRKVRQWQTLLCARAVENELFVAGLSRCDRHFGAEDRNYAGHSCVFDPNGDLIAAARGASEELVLARIDRALVTETRAAMPCLDHRRPDLY